MNNTPETDLEEIVIGRTECDRYVLAEFARKLERERHEYKQKCRIALSERDSWRLRAEQKYAIRRELEELLGVDHNEASDEQLQRGIDAIKNIMRERDEARELNSKLRDIADRAIQLLPPFTRMVDFGSAENLRAELDQLKEGGK